MELAYHNSPELRSYKGVPDFDSYSNDENEHMPAEKQKELIHGYYACTSFVDAQVGRLLDALKEQGLSENTAIILWGDHGWHLGDHGLWCKHTTFEQATRSPMIIVSPGIERVGQTTAPSEFVDVFPTLCDLVGVAIPGNIDGTSLVPMMKDPSASVKKVAVSQWPRGKSAMGYALRNQRYRYVEWIEDCRMTDKYDAGKVVGRELYDYEKDPMETVNVVADPEYAAVVEAMNRQLQDFFAAQK